MKIILNKIFKFIIILLWIILFYLLITNKDLKPFVLNFCTNNKLLAPILFISIQLFLSVLALPCSPITVLAGLIWGMQTGFFISVLSTIISSIVTFLLGKYIITKMIKEKDIFNFWHKLNDIINKYTWKSSLVAHANPLFPGSSLGYLFGASSLSFRLFLIGCILGTIPLQLIAVFIGDFLNY